MRRPLIGILALCAAAYAAHATYPDGYYDSLEGKCGVELMHAVSDLALASPKVIIDYGNDTWAAFARERKYSTLTVASSRAACRCRRESIESPFHKNFNVRGGMF